MAHVLPGWNRRHHRRHPCPGNNWAQRNYSFRGQFTMHQAGRSPLSIRGPELLHLPDQIWQKKNTVSKRTPRQCSPVVTYSEPTVWSAGSKSTHRALCVVEQCFWERWHRSTWTILNWSSLRRIFSFIWRLIFVTLRDKTCQGGEFVLWAQGVGPVYGGWNRYRDGWSGNVLWTEFTITSALFCPSHALSLILHIQDNFEAHWAPETGLLTRGNIGLVSCYW